MLNTLRYGVQCATGRGLIGYLHSLLTGARLLVCDSELVTAIPLQYSDESSAVARVNTSAMIYSSQNMNFLLNMFLNIHCCVVVNTCSTKIENSKIQYLKEISYNTLNSSNDNKNKIVHDQYEKNCEI